MSELKSGAFYLVFVGKSLTPSVLPMARPITEVMRLVAICSFLVFGGVSLAATIANGSFEQGLNPGVTKPAGSTDITGWTVLPTDIDWVGGVAATPEILASDGALYVDLNGLTAGGIRQTIITIVGQSYTVTFDMNANGDEGFRTRSVQVSAGADNGVYSAISQPTWVTYNFVFTATSASTDLDFVSLFTVGTACGPDVDSICSGPMIDNVRISDVPEPATLGLVGVGLAWGLWKRRKRS